MLGFRKEGGLNFVCGVVGCVGIGDWDWDWDWGGC